ncbi:MAG: hypothetical protein EAZ42_09450 [Verrucomicrobia bacterium]|nr:MAG: hypothetical protein EAZ42_09450 [Verrucomicrobiota bacterium]
MAFEMASVFRRFTTAGHKIFEVWDSSDLRVLLELLGARCAREARHKAGGNATPEQAEFLRRVET